MSVNYVAAVKTSRMQVVRDAINAGSGPGLLVIGTTGMGTRLAEIPLTDPVTVSGAILTLLSSPSTIAAIADGTAASAIIEASDGTDVATGLTVGTTGTDVILDSTSVTSGQNVTINSATITHG